MHSSGLWSTSSHIDRAGTFGFAIDRYQAARSAVTTAGDTSDAALDAWGGSVDRVIATRAANCADLASKIGVMLVEKRGGDGALLAILEDLESMTEWVELSYQQDPAAASMMAAAVAEQQGFSADMLEELADRLVAAARLARSREGKAVGHA